MMMKNVAPKSNFALISWKKIPFLYLNFFFTLILLSEGFVFSLVNLQATAMNRCKKVVEEGIYCQRPRLVPHQDDEGAITSLHLLRTSPFS